MAPNPPEVTRLDDSERRLEQAFIEEFLRGRGYSLGTVHALPEDEAKRLLREASIYAAGKLAEVEARSHYVHEIHRER